LVTDGGYGLGTLCVIDVQPRTVDPALIDDLSDLASVVIDQLELRLSARTTLDRAQLMAREIDHRVMNSLQFVSGLLAMQSRTTNGEAAAQLPRSAFPALPGFDATIKAIRTQSLLALWPPQDS
jgi:hypothetical protein